MGISPLRPLLPLLCLALLGCSTVPPPSGAEERSCPGGGRSAARIAQPLSTGLEQPPEAQPVSARFNSHWRDGRAEVAGYAVTVSRYGQLRKGRAVLITVTEPMDARTWIKDDRNQAGEHRVEVLKLNHAVTFDTGIYPYSLLTSVFAPVKRAGIHRFAPAKISFSAQEWCGHVYQQIHPKGDRFHSELHSYFGAEGDRGETVGTARGTLYEDALWIQLRELDGPFAGGGNWSGQLVPSLWQRRKAHLPLRPVPAVIRRAKATAQGREVTRFTLTYAGVTRTFDLEPDYPHRILAWRSGDGSGGRLLKSTRLAYWELNKLGDERYRQQLGFE